MPAPRLECEQRRDAHLANAFFVLEAAPGASRAEVERQGAKLLAMLAADVEGAATFPTPLGPGRRDAESVRAALAVLRDPARRLVHEWWARGLMGEPAGSP
jgi:hypothetical protein